MIDVSFTRTGLRSAEVAVVIDVLRATSTVTQALAAGYRSVVCVDSVQRAARLRAPGRVIAGEQRCITPPGFDQGNSPREALAPLGDELVVATTNGARTIVAAAPHARQVLLASLLNLKAVLQAREEDSELELQIVCAGTDDAPALEDAYLAGRICAALSGERRDAAPIAEAVAQLRNAVGSSDPRAQTQRAQRGQSRGRHRTSRARVKTPSGLARAEPV